MQFRRGRRIWKPEVYQGTSDMKKYFEGWYFKIVDKEEKNVYAIIPGVSFDKKGNTHAFIMFFDGIKASMNYLRFDISEFQYSKDVFQIDTTTGEFIRQDLWKGAHLTAYSGSTPATRATAGYLIINNTFDRTLTVAPIYNKNLEWDLRRLEA